ncbi:NAD(P)-dependent dehydrogenase, short-chain alcohol dehydrogenase family [Lentzea waywayandensis]|uniref:NAD(P)-dependent dehydrogenase, short-chain alcohol dehydrogenase family n=1 Tax=Lentzea waywayandensis TaxID=84724 RepID=A0A1I6DBM1_9PSEU|nr:SDR family NAD(P)-dependent oxidoreductase [Lentzea waywayandensis]SFR02829.1 NAD(P)-dependent dehydrogenase, short-chain alcohol dehydrogenase family [Lentzea waywayandensis]
MSPLPIALVTGGSHGVGFDAARALLADGHVVVLHARTAEQSWDAAQRLVDGGADPTRVHPVDADFASLDSVTLLARQVAAEHPVLDLLVNAATIVGSDRCVITEDGNDLALQVNYLAPVLLTRGLEGPMGRASAPRVINLSSEPHRGGSPSSKDFTRSELALTMLTNALAKASTAVNVDPGGADPKLLHLDETRAKAVLPSPRVSDQPVVWPRLTLTDSGLQPEDGV